MGVAYSKRMARGLCGFCGHEATISGNRYPRPHAERRVRRGPDGRPEIYATDTDCPGVAMQADPLHEKAALQPMFQAPGATI